jgi:hypothetical protein
MKIYKLSVVLIITFFVFFTNFLSFIVTPIHQFLFPCRGIGCNGAYFPNQFIIIFPNFKQIPISPFIILVIIVWLLLIKLSFYLLNKYLSNK